jgi:hypothetical protein
MLERYFLEGSPVVGCLTVFLPLGQVLNIPNLVLTLALLIPSSRNLGSSFFGYSLPKEQATKLTFFISESLPTALFITPICLAISSTLLSPIPSEKESSLANIAQAYSKKLTLLMKNAL